MLLGDGLLEQAAGWGMLGILRIKKAHSSDLSFLLS